MKVTEEFINAINDFMLRNSCTLYCRSPKDHISAKIGTWRLSTDDKWLKLDGVFGTTTALFPMSEMRAEFIENYCLRLNRFTRGIQVYTLSIVPYYDNGRFVKDFKSFLHERGITDEDHE